MRYRRKAEPEVVVSVMTCRALARVGERQHHAGRFPFHGLAVDAHRLYDHSDPMLVLYRDGVEIGQLGEHDKLVIEDDGAVYPVARDAFEVTYERDPNWCGGPPESGA